MTRKPVSSAASAFGIDIGGTGMKGAPVDTATGQLLSDRQRIATPHPATPDAVAAVVVDRCSPTRTGPDSVGATFPAIIKHGVADSAANVDKSWIGTDVDAVFTKATPSGTDVIVLNDADAAGLAEARFGAARGVVGRGHPAHLRHRHRQCAADGRQLVPNTELGHLELDGHDAETRAAASVRDAKDCPTSGGPSGSNAYMRHVEHSVPPDLFVVGGGVSKDAGEVGAALEAQDAGQAGGAAEQRRHRRCCDGRRRAARRVTSRARRRPRSTMAARALRTYWTRPLSRQTDGRRPDLIPASSGALNAADPGSPIRPTVKGLSWHPAEHPVRAVGAATRTAPKR